MDPLDYGRRFTIDASSLSGSREPENALRDCIVRLHNVLEGERVEGEVILLAAGDGASAAVRGGEAHASLHYFPAFDRVCLQAFSRRDLLLSDLTALLAEYFGPGRFASHLGNVSRALPSEPESLRRMLAGDRDYIRVRLHPHLLGG